MSIFTKVKAAKLKSSRFNLSEEHKLSCNFGEMIPILCKEVLPSDNFEVSTELLIKFAPMKAPIMHRVKAKVDYFFVPNFQLTDLFSDFINPKVNTASNPVVLPYTSPSAINQYGKRSGASDLISSLADYLGMPVTQSGYWSYQGSSEPLSVLPFMAYQHIYNSYFRDQNMEVIESANPATTSLFLVDKFKKQAVFGASTVGANQMANLLQLRTSAWKKDYFTSALPSPQAGDDVELAFAGGKTPVYLDTDNMPFSDHRTQLVTDNQGSDFNTAGSLLHNNQAKFQSAGTGGIQSDAFLDPNNTMFVDVPGGSITINNLRRLFALQRFRELAERGGTRYPEMVHNFFMLSSLTGILTALYILEVRFSPYRSVRLFRLFQMQVILLPIVVDRRIHTERLALCALSLLAMVLLWVFFVFCLRPLISRASKGCGQESLSMTMLSLSLLTLVSRRFLIRRYLPMVMPMIIKFSDTLRDMLSTRQVIATFREHLEHLLIIGTSVAPLRTVLS